jgi:tight adherence protein B
LQRFGISHYGFSVCLAAISAGLPFLYLVLKKTKRMQKFERQLPEGLDLIARALKAGHAFSSGLQLVADQFDDPMGTEFGETIDEINYGVSIPDALKNLCGRVDCQDLKYFVISVSLQRETGGNLAEILQSIARIIRERFKFQQKLKTLSAESRFSAVILVCLPFVIIGAISFMNPHYLRVLFTEPAGKIMLVGAGIMMMTGIIVMKKILKIQV